MVGSAKEIVGFVVIAFGVCNEMLGLDARLSWIDSKGGAAECLPVEVQQRDAYNFFIFMFHVLSMTVSPSVYTLSNACRSDILNSMATTVHHDMFFLSYAEP